MADFTVSQIGPTVSIPVRPAWPGDALTNICTNGSPLDDDGWTVTGFSWDTVADPGTFRKTVVDVSGSLTRTMTLPATVETAQTFYIRVITSDVNYLTAGVDSNQFTVTLGTWEVPEETIHQITNPYTGSTTFVGFIVMPKTEPVTANVFTLTAGIEWSGNIESIEVFQMTNISDSEINGAYNKIALAFSEMGRNSGSGDLAKGVPYSKMQDIYGYLAKNSVRAECFPAGVITDHMKMQVKTPTEALHPANMKYVDDLKLELVNTENPIAGLSILGTPKAIVTAAHDNELVFGNPDGWNVNEYSANVMIVPEDIYQSSAFGHISFHFQNKREWVWSRGGFENPSWHGNLRYPRERLLLSILHQAATSEEVQDSIDAISQGMTDNDPMEVIRSDTSFRGTAVSYDQLSGGFMDKFTQIYTSLDGRFNIFDLQMDGLIYKGTYWSFQYFYWRPDKKALNSDHVPFTHAVFIPFLNGSIKQ